MSLILPQPTDKLNNPGHSKLHRVVAVDELASEQTIQVLQALVDIAVNIQALNLSGTNTGDETLSTILSKLGYTPEDVANKAVDFSVVNNTKFPTVQAAKAYMDSLVVGLIDDRGNYNASTNLFPSTGGSGTAGAILKGDLWFVSVAGTLGGVAVGIGDQIRALVDTPGQTSGNWGISEANIGYVPENTANKSTNTALGTSDTLFPTQKAVKAYVDALAAIVQPLDADLTQIAAISQATDILITSIGGVWSGQTLQATKTKMNYRIVALTDAATVTLNADTTDIGVLATLSQTTNFANPTGTPVNGQEIAYRIKSSITRNMTWGSKFRGMGGLNLQTYTAGNNITEMKRFVYNATDDKWDMLDPLPIMAKYFLTSQSGLTVGGETVVHWNSTVYDTNPSAYNAGTYRWTAPLKGRYKVVFQIVWASDGAGPAGDFTEGRIYKNGTAIANNGGEIGFSIYGDSLQVSTELEMNGTTDYLEWRILSPGAAVNPILFGGQSLTYTTITYVSPI